MFEVTSISSLVRSITGALVWLVANVVYLDKRRRGRRGIARFFAFWLGLPVSFVTLVVLREGEEELVRPPEDDEEALLREVRQDRALREGSPEDGA